MAMCTTGQLFNQKYVLSPKSKLKMLAHTYYPHIACIKKEMSIPIVSWLNNSQKLEFQLPNFWDVERTVCGWLSGRTNPKQTSPNLTKSLYWRGDTIRQEPSKGGTYALSQACGLRELGNPHFSIMCSSTIFLADDYVLGRQKMHKIMHNHSTFFLIF
jgi:hypothetical protein